MQNYNSVLTLLWEVWKKDK